LLESILVLSLLSIAMAVIFYAFSASMRIFTSEMWEADASLEVHRAMERMTKELRGALEVVSASGTSVTFWYSDLNGDGTREANETVTFSWTGTSEGYINRTVLTATQEISTGIKKFSFTYNDPSPPNIKFITIFLSAQKGSTVSTLESSVDCRNL
jgi:type II secretory pathway pseudopilin PulG